MKCECSNYNGGIVSHHTQSHFNDLQIIFWVSLIFHCSNYFSVYSASNLLVLLNDSILRKDLRWISSMVSDQQPL